MPAALASSLYSTIRLLADQMQIADVREALRIDQNVPVGFQRMKVGVNLVPSKGTDPSKVKDLIAASEYCSINLQTLQSGVQVDNENHLGLPDYNYNQEFRILTSADRI